jgi:hypothetical protein
MLLMGFLPAVLAGMSRMRTAVLSCSADAARGCCCCGCASRVAQSSLAGPSTGAGWRRLQLSNVSGELHWRRSVSCRGWKAHAAVRPAPALPYAQCLSNCRLDRTRSLMRRRGGRAVRGARAGRRLRSQERRSAVRRLRRRAARRAARSGSALRSAPCPRQQVGARFLPAKNPKTRGRAASRTSRS